MITIQLKNQEELDSIVVALLGDAVFYDSRKEREKKNEVVALTERLVRHDTIKICPLCNSEFTRYANCSKNQARLSWDDIQSGDAQ